MESKTGRYRPDLSCLPKSKRIFPDDLIPLFDADSLPFPFPSTGQQLRLTFSRLTRPSEPELFPFFQGDGVISVAMARFLKPFSRHGGSVSSSASREDCPNGKDAGEVERMDYLEFIARVTSHIPDKGQVTVRYFGLYANAHRGKVRKASLGPFPLRRVEEELRRLPAKGWAEMIRKVYEVDPLLCPKCGGKMKVIAFLTDYSVVDRIINHLKVTFVADRPPPPHIAYQEILMAAETSAEYFS